MLSSFLTIGAQNETIPLHPDSKRQRNPRQERPTKPSALSFGPPCAPCNLQGRPCNLYANLWQNFENFAKFRQRFAKKNFFHGRQSTVDKVETRSLNLSFFVFCRLSTVDREKKFVFRNLWQNFAKFSKFRQRFACILQGRPL